MTAPASGTHTRIQMQRPGHALIPHGTVHTYDPVTGVFTAFMDFQMDSEPPYIFTPEDPLGKFTDQHDLPWNLVR